MTDGDRNAGESSAESSGRRSKVQRVIDKYDVPELSDELERRWTRSDGESLRELADYFNTEILAAALADTGQQRLEGEASHYYNLLTNDDVTAGMRTQTERRLEREGIDVDSLTDDFVSHQAVHTYLTKFRDIEYPEEETGDRIESARETLQQLRSRTQAVTDTTVDSLRKNNAVDLGDYNVFVGIQIMCIDCQHQYSFDELLEEGRCQCAGE
jgi:hypothetical protein